MRVLLLRSTILLALLAGCLLLTGCGGEMGQADRRIQHPSMTDPISSGHSYQDSASYMQYFP